MGTTEKQVIECTRRSDVKNLTVDTVDGAVWLGVVEADANLAIELDAVPLISAQLLPSQAVKLARALLRAAGLPGQFKPGRGIRYTFID